LFSPHASEIHGIGVEAVPAAAAAAEVAGKKNAEEAHFGHSFMRRVRFPVAVSVVQI
jgi:hypothetical protein